MFKNRIEGLPDGDNGGRPLNGPDIRPQDGPNGSSHPSGAAAPESGRRRISLRSVVLGIVLGTVIGLPATIFVLTLLQKSDLPQMKPADFLAAQRRWSEQGPADYDLDIDAGMGLNGQIHVEVRGGNPGTMTFDGKPTRPGLWDYWTIAGLLGVIQLDVERNEAAAKHPGSPEPMPLFLQAQFDPKNGLPTFYRRTELASGESGQWQIVGFHPR